MASETARFAGASPRPHPLSRVFAWREHRGPGRLLSAGQLRQFDEQGYVVLERAVPPAVLARALAEIDPVEARVEAFLRTRADGKLFIARAGEITFTTHLVTRSAWLRDFVSAPLFRDLAFDVIGPDVRLYWDQAVYKKPDTEAPFPWHQDNGYVFVEPEAYLTCWIALTDATLDNGCPILVPGLHRRGTLVHVLTDLGFVCLDEAADTRAAPVPAGSIVVLSSLTPHCTGPNRSGDVRKAYIVQYADADAEIVTATGDGSVTRSRCDQPDRQFPLLSGGEPPPGLPAGWPAA